MQAYVFTSTDIAEALVRAHRDRHIKVLVVIDKGHDKFDNDKTDYLAGSGVEVRIDEYHDGIAHDKVMVIDRVKVITGSFNYTFPAESKNAENLIVIDQPEVASLYLDNWELHWGHSKQLGGQPVLQAGDAIAAEEAVKRVNQVVTVRMTVAKVGAFGDSIYLNYRAPYDVPGNLAFRVQPTAKPARFPDWPAFQRYLSSLQGKVVQVEGKVTPYQDRFEIEARAARPSKWS